MLTLFNLSTSILSYESTSMDPDQLELALAVITSGQSIRKTAKQFHVTRDYLQRRIKGTLTRKEVNSTR